MTFENFEKLARSFNFVPVYERIAADLLTPVTAYLKIRKKDNVSFLLESVEGIGRLARYSFIGVSPAEIISNYFGLITIKSSSAENTFEGNIFDYLKKRVSEYAHPTIDGLPYFTGGLVGFFGFDNISLIEDVIPYDEFRKGISPDSVFGLYKTIIVFDHFKHQIILITNVDCNDKSNLNSKYDSAKATLAALKQTLNNDLQYKSDFTSSLHGITEGAEAEFLNLVEYTKKNIHAGDVFQVVLSKRFEADYRGDSFNVYRALRMINPSPYMYYMEFENDFKVIGTSPEDLLKVKNRNAEILPIAGTRRRGKSEEEDMLLEKELLSDPKEIAEHIMLVDLARNDLGRICKLGTVQVSEQMKINRFSHVMHIVSRVEGKLKDNADCIDALKASFPAGTVSGAPKIRAIQIINHYEKTKRGVYAGAVGYIDFSGNLDMCIAIRTLFVTKEKIYWQAGAGIVADSIPELELKEIKNKSAVLVSALKCAEVIDENLSN
ncbi:MAG: anthranilate synthase component I [Ignavibacteria bacterium]|nr:MAG: anthranilate synthase component I [Ignavibacteria bacterium]KAF0161972.1 MAG: anthranilate synthase component I [Ignavibacteria bacterium]